MLELDGKKLTYQHPDLKQLENKREAAYFLHRQVSLPWIQRAASEGIQAGFIALFLNITMSFDSLIFCSGGTKGISYLGCIKYFMERDKLNDFNEYELIGTIKK